MLGKYCRKVYNAVADVDVPNREFYMRMIIDFSRFIDECEEKEDWFSCENYVYQLCNIYDELKRLHVIDFKLCYQARREASLCLL